MAEAFIFAQMTIHDQALFDEYSPLAAKTVLDHGGSFVIGGKGPRELLEGDSMPFVAVAKFPSYEQALRWYHSDDYAPLIEMRDRAAKGSVMLLEGLDPAD